MDIWFGLKDLLKNKKDFADSQILKHNEFQNIHQASDRDGHAQGISRARELAREDTMPEVASTSGFYVGNMGMLDYPDSFNSPSCSYSSAGSLSDINKAEDDLSVHPSTSETAFPYGRRNCLRSRKSSRRIIKPLTSLESCLVAQLFQERTEMEEYIFSSAPSRPTQRPFLVTNGNVVISRASGEFYGKPVGTELNGLQKSVVPQEKTIYGFPQLPNSGSRELRRRASASRKSQDKQKHHQLQGSSNEAFLLSLGISIGIFFSFSKYKKEIDKLNQTLKQTDNLVQDLQDELEMKDSLTVKELATEDYESEYMQIDYPNSEALTLNKTSEYCAEEYQSQRSGEETMSKIEAELEAELERLELNMNSTKLEGKLTELVELDPDFIPDLAEGELREDIFDRTKPLHSADRDESSNSTPHSANYAVSPRELSLRLHKVIRSQLEERVRELETALETSQRKVRHMEVELSNSWRDFSNSDACSSSAQVSPVAKDERLPYQDCVVMNLAGDALDAYNEAYDELSRFLSSEEDQKALGDGKIKDQEHMQPRDRDHDLDRIYNGLQIDENESPDEAEKRLIEHIVERARKGSHAVVSAKKALFNLDENEH